MDRKFVNKALTVYCVGLLASLIWCGGVTFGAYALINWLDIAILGDYIQFKIALGGFEVCICLYAMLEVSDHVLFGGYEDELDDELDPEIVFSEEGL